MNPKNGGNDRSRHTVSGRSVDLLKVDVERAEKEVLEGILPSDWPKIRQVAMEVHDVDGGLQTVVSRIADH